MPRLKKASDHVGRSAYKPTIREAILHNASLPEAERLTYTEISKRLGVRRESVYVAVANMRMQGQIGPKEDKPQRDVLGPAATVDPYAVVDRVLETSAALEPLENTAVMTKDERARKLSLIGRTAPAAVAVNAVTRLDEMERTSGITVGPPDPISQEDKADRLAGLMMICGKRIVNRAVKLAFKGNLEPDPAPVIPPESPAEPESSERDLHSPEPTPSSTT